MGLKCDTGLALLGGRAIRAGKEFPGWPRLGGGEAAALARVLESGRWGIGGEETGKFELDFAAYQGCKRCVTMANGSVTLRNALLACGLEEGGEVIVPPYTFLATATAVLEANGVPVFVDIAPDTYCLDPAGIEAVITPNTQVVIPVHLGGHAADMDAIMAIARKHQLHVIEDCAHAHGAEHKGRRVGSIGDLGSFSFQSSKNLCSGEGGAIVSNDEGLADKCWSVHNCGRAKDGAWYGHERLGGNYRLSQFQAAVLNEQLKKLDGETELRQRNAAYLDAKLSQIPGVRPLGRRAEATRHAYHLYLFRYDQEAFDGLGRSVFLEALRAEGIPASEGYGTLVYQQPFMRGMRFAPFCGWRRANPGLSYAETKCPVAERAAAVEGCWLPQSVLLGTREDMDDIVDAVAKIYERRSSLSGKTNSGVSR